jgi:hypothetical protein
MFRKALILLLANLICAGTALAKAPARGEAQGATEAAVVRVVAKDAHKKRLSLRFKVSRPITLRAELGARARRPAIAG